MCSEETIVTRRGKILYYDLVYTGTLFNLICYFEANVLVVLY